MQETHINDILLQSPVIGVYLISIQSIH